ncbi:MAG: fumarylacetoacetate hydrolase family protein [Anaerovoracaceae bacterium]|jgi:2-keto-4-pentenoate hydratase/2-oxohepta-3-ene-1,7-dioic acid hydratase in catechol pathway
MKFVRFEDAGRPEIGVMTAEEGRIAYVDEVLGTNYHGSMTEFISTVRPEQIALLRKFIEKPYLPQTVLERTVKITAPITRPIHDILCVGVNYRSHREEVSDGIDQSHENAPKSIYFSKRAVRILGPGESIESRLDLDPELDYEVELAVIIGKRGKDIPRGEAENYIFGYSVFNDISSRTLQREHVQWLKGKSLDTYTSMGPAIVTRDELPLPLSVDIISRLNGEERQHSNTSLMLNDVPGIIADLSAGMTLEPGDIIATGTSAGVGMGMDPPGFMKTGDIITCEIPEIGRLTNYII